MFHTYALEPQWWALPALSTLLCRRPTTNFHRGYLVRILSLSSYHPRPLRHHHSSVLPSGWYSLPDTVLDLNSYPSPTSQVPLYAALATPKLSIAGRTMSAPSSPCRSLPIWLTGYLAIFSSLQPTARYCYDASNSSFHRHLPHR